MMRSTIRKFCGSGIFIYLLLQASVLTAGAQISRSAVELNKAGLEYLAKSDYVKAIEQFSRAIGAALPPDTQRQPLFDPVLSASQDNHTFGPIALTKDLAVLYLDRGIAYAATDQIDPAINDFDRAIYIWPSLAEAYCRRGNLRLAKNDIQGAFDDLDRSVRLGPDLPIAFITRAYARSDHGDVKGALADIARAIKLAPKEAVAFYVRGAIYENSGDFENATADYDHSISLNPTYAEPLCGRGRALLREGHFDAAVAVFSAAIQLDRNFATAYADRGVALYFLGKTVDGEKDIQRALGLSPSLRAQIEAFRREWH